MADEDVATRAPESDAQEAQTKSGIPGDTKADQGAASMGEITRYNEIEVYVSKPSDYPHNLRKAPASPDRRHRRAQHEQPDPSRQICGRRFPGCHARPVHLPNPTSAATRSHKTYRFGGDPAPTTTTSTAPAEAHPTIIEQVKLGVASVAKSFTIDMWLARHTPEKVLPILHSVLTSVKEEYADAVSSGGGIYAVGYCFGAKYALLLAADLHKDVAAGQRAPETQAEEGMAREGPQIKCGAIAHGTQITVEELAGVSVPMCVVAVKDDPLFPDHVREQGVEAMQKKGVEHEVSVYDGVPHGFAVLGDYADEGIVEKQKEAFEQMLAWLKKH
ncbi:hypothetical protein LTS09_012860 [Friedmanniomyces endolithicus]|nr:hypothetical protein LTS09_012860 [Friedmanniomyces endolithicus]